MLYRLVRLQVLSGLLHLSSMLQPELLHFPYSLLLVHQKDLIPPGRELLQLKLILLLNLHLLPTVLVLH